MTAYVIQNSVPTPEEMAHILGVSPERLAAVRRIMSTPVRKKRTNSFAYKKSTVKDVASREKSAKVQGN